MRTFGSVLWKAWYSSACLQCVLCQGSGWWGWRVGLPNFCSPPKAENPWNYYIHYPPNNPFHSFILCISRSLCLSLFFPEFISIFTLNISLFLPWWLFEKMKHGNSSIHSWSTSYDLPSTKTSSIHFSSCTAHILCWYWFFKPELTFFWPLGAAQQTVNILFTHYHLLKFKFVSKQFNNLADIQ